MVAKKITVYVCPGCGRVKNSENGRFYRQNQSFSKFLKKALAARVEMINLVSEKCADCKIRHNPSEVGVLEKRE